MGWERKGRAGGKGNIGRQRKGWEEEGGVGNLSTHAYR